ncbi:hypothetical protein VBQ42_15515 [Klebsiella pneumoniae]|nr:hypothetical protein [Klebsiella pneumoniae]
MTKSAITRERLEEIVSDPMINQGSEFAMMARMALAAMDSEPHTDDELSNLLWYSQEATCHSDPNYYCEFQRLATPGLIAGIIRELQERRKADREPVAEVVSIYGDPEAFGEREIRPLVGIQQMPYGTKLYRHAQPVPVVSADLLHTAASAIEDLLEHADPNTSYYSGVWADVPGKLRAAMFQAKSLTGNSPVIGIDLASGPDRTVEVHYVAPPGYVMVPKEPTEAMMLHNSGCQHHAWDDPDCAMRQTRRLIWSHMLAAAPQKVK